MKQYNNSLYSNQALFDILGSSFVKLELTRYWDYDEDFRNDIFRVLSTGGILRLQYNDPANPASQVFCLIPGDPTKLFDFFMGQIPLLKELFGKNIRYSLVDEVATIQINVDKYCESNPSPAKKKPCPKKKGDPRHA